MSESAPERQLQKQLKDERSTLHDLAWELDEVEVQLAELEQHPGGAPQAADAAHLENLRQRRQRLEEAVLQQMLYIDRLQQALDQAQYPRVQAA
jgi:hypothetical protein